MKVLLQNETVPRSFMGWRERLRKMEERERRFEQWVFLNASSVLLSEKTGELLALHLDEMGMSVAEVEEGLRRVSAMWGVRYRMLFESNRLVKFIVYHEGRLQEVLDEAPYCVMVGKLNYPSPLEAGEFLDEIARRWEEQGGIPHEIGVALGYPLDDVFGYMGLLPLDCKGVCGWRVYGCMKESRRRSSAFNDARCRALTFLAAAA